MAETSSDEAAIIRRNAAGQWELSLSTLGYSEPLRIKGQLGECELILPVPDGLAPLTLQAQALVSPDVEDGYLEVSDGQRSLLSLALARPRTSLKVPLNEAELQDQKLYLQFTVRLRTVDDACASSLSGAWLELRSATLVLGGEARPPREISSFFPPILTALRVFVPQAPTSAESEAVLNLAMAVTCRYVPQRPTIQLETLAQDGSLPLHIDVTPFERAVVIREGPFNQVSLEATPSGWPLLFLSGPAAALSRTSRLLASKLAPMLAAPAVEAIQFDQVEEIQGERFALSSLSAAKLQVSGVGRMEIPISFTQADLGGPIRTLALRLHITHTPPAAGAQAVLSIYFNSALLRTSALGRAGSFDLYLSIPKELIHRDNVLLVRFEYTPPEGRCRLGIEPFTAQISPESHLQIRRGQTLPPGFNRFPQTLSQGFEVAFEQFDQESLASALGLVVALQRLSKTPLRLTIVPWGRALLSKKPALFIASTPHSASTLKPPLVAEPLAITDQDGHEIVRLEAKATFAALEAFESQGRDVLLLTHRGDRGAELCRQLVSALEATPQGWRTLRGDVLLQTSSAGFQTLRLRGGALKVESLTASGLSQRPGLRLALYLIALCLLFGFLAWAYPRVVRRSLSP